MKEIKLTDGQIAFVDDEDFDRLSKFIYRPYYTGKRTYAVRGKFNYRIAPTKETNTMSGLGRALGRWLCAHGHHAWAYPLSPLGEHLPRKVCRRCNVAGERWDERP